MPARGPRRRGPVHGLADGVRAHLPTGSGPAFEPRFPHVNPHRLRHSFAIRTLERLVSGHYRQAARLVADTGPDAALAFYLSKADPLMVLRDLLGHSSVLTTEKYLRQAGHDAHLPGGLRARRAGRRAAGRCDADAEREADAEFAEAAEGES